MAANKQMRMLLALHMALGACSAALGDDNATCPQGGCGDPAQGSALVQRGAGKRIQDSIRVAEAKGDLPPELLKLLQGQAGGGDGLEEKLQHALDMHNYYRCLHGASALAWDDALHASSLQWGEQLAQAGSLQHSQDTGVGENLAWGSPSMSGIDAVKGWYNEVNWYDAATGESTTGQPVGHFTQVVWKSSTKVGCASVKKTSPKKEEFWVCQYTPQGNYYMVGKKAEAYTENVGSLTSATCTNPEDSLPCVDVLDAGNCGLYKQYSYCNHPYVKKNCKSTCGECS